MSPARHEQTSTNPPTYAVPSDSKDDYKTILLTSDFHPEEREEKGQDSLRKTIRNSILWYAEKYDADTLGVGGDIGGVSDVKSWFVEGENEDAYLADAFESVKIALGDGDTEKDGWYRVARNNENNGQNLLRELDEQGIEYGNRITFPPDGDRKYPVKMSHDPKDLGLDWYTTPEQASVWGKSHEMDEPQVLLYGHTHAPYTRVLRNTIAIGMPSRFKNYSIKGRKEKEGMPDRSLQILRLGQKDVEVYHIDLTKENEKDQLFEYQRFSLEDEGFVEDIEYGVVDIEKRFILPQKYYDLQEEAEQLIGEQVHNQQKLVMAD